MPKVPTEPQERALFTFERWRDLDGFYRYHTSRWRRSLDFLRGQHWDALKQLNIDAIPAWKKFPMVNYTLAFYMDYLSDWLKTEVRYSAIPEGVQAADISAAELADQLSQYLWDKLDFDLLKIDLGAWICSTGNGVLRFFWNTNTGNLVPLGSPTPQGPNVPQDPAAQQQMVDQGEIGVEVISPQFVRWGGSPSHGVMVGMLLNEDEVAQVYGPEVVPNLKFSDSFSGFSFDLNQIELPGYSSKKEERTLVIEHYIPKSNENEGGLWWTGANEGNILLTQPAPLPAGVIPVVNFRWVPIPGEEHMGQSPIYDMTFSNKIYEQNLARLMEWYTKVTPKTLLKIGGGIAKGDLTDEPMQELEVNAGGEPEALEFRQPPPGFSELMDRAQRDMGILSGTEFEEQDKPPEGVPGSFRAPSRTQPGNKTALAIINSRHSWRKVGEVMLSYVATFYTEPRVIGIQGPDKQYQWKEFIGSDLKDLPSRIRVEEIPLYPWTRQGLRDTVIGLLSSQAGQIMFMGPDGAPDQGRIRRALEAAGIDRAMEDLDEDILEARNEQSFFQNLKDPQEAPQVQPWQDHPTHHQEHVRVLKSLEFRAWSEPGQQTFIEHVQQTEQILNEAAQAEAQAMIEQERQLREVREQEELKADIQRELAVKTIELVLESTDRTVNDVVKALLKAQEPEETSTEE